MNNVKLNVYKQVLQKVCEKFNGAEDFIKERIEELCSNGKLSLDRGNLFVYQRLRQLLKLKIVVFFLSLLPR